MIKISEKISPKQKIYRLIFVFFFAGIIFLLSAWNPESQPLTNCQFRELTGLSCPTCGMSRSLHEAAQLHFLKSLKFHGSGIFVFGGLIFLSAWILSEIISGKKLAWNLSSKAKKALLLTIMSIWLFSWLINIMRDLDFF